MGQYEWYVDTILQLISAAGDHVGAEVWYRVVQLVTNNEDLQPYAASAVFRHLRGSTCHETMIKVGGQPATLTLDLTDSCPSQATFLASLATSLPTRRNAAQSSNSKRYIRKSTFVQPQPDLCCSLPTSRYASCIFHDRIDRYQWVNLFPEISEHLINIFERYTHVLDAELQQRACEYLALARRSETDDLLATLCDEMPVFPERESALINRLHSKGEKSQDKRTWIIGHQTENKGREAQRFKALRKVTPDTTSPATLDNTPVAPPPQLQAPVPQRSLNTNTDTMMGTTSNGPAEDIMSTLADLDLSGNSVQDEPLLPDSGSHATPVRETDGDVKGGERDLVVNGIVHTATLGGVNPSLLAPLTVAPNVEKVGHYIACRC